MLHTAFSPRAFALVALGVLTSSAPAHAQQLQYTVTVTNIPVAQGVPLRINNRGQILGGGSGSVGIWSPPPATPPFRGLGQLDAQHHSVIAGYGINDNGQVCGMGQGAINGHGYPVAGTIGAMHYLSTDLGVAFAINSAGDIVGSSSGVADYVGVVWQHDGQLRGLPVVRANDPIVLIAALNDAGDAAGTTGGGPVLPSRVALWPANGTPRTLVSFPNAFDSVTAMNASRQVVGCWVDSASNRHACLWRDAGQPVDIGRLPFGGGSGALGINEFGLVVGESFEDGANAPLTGWAPLGYAFLWTPVTGIIALDSLIPPPDPDQPFLSWHIIAACDINDRGEIAAFATLPGTTTTRAVLLRPVRLNLADIAGSFGTALPDGQLNADDVIQFLSSFFSATPAISDLAGPGGIAGPDGRLTADDVIVFLSAFFGGQ